MMKKHKLLWKNYLPYVNFKDKKVKNLKVPGTNNNSICKENVKKIVEENSNNNLNNGHTQQIDRKKISPENFLRKYEELLSKASKLVNMTVDKESVNIRFIKELCIKES
jgi:hypothetical protein